VSALDKRFMAAKARF